ncbi:MAG TPA: hypothetical protein EYG89_01190 [Bacteroidia bacterium]|nr:hypothetical protein [Bacteroidia bacterium]
MKISRARMAQIANVTTRTIINWEKEKPELIEIIKKGIEADNNYKEFFKLFEPYKFWSLHNFYLDFYFKFLNYFRQNITLKDDIVKFGIRDINCTAVLYLMEKHKSELFDKRLMGNEKIDMNNFQREEFIKPLFGVDEELSKYILRNTLDGFGLLVNDALYKDESLFEDSLTISITYLVYMFYPLTHYKEKEKIIQSIFENELNCNIHSYIEDPKRETDKETIYKNYLKFKKELFIENLDDLIDELEMYSTNDFYVPTLIKEIEKTMK